MGINASVVGILFSVLPLQLLFQAGVLNIYDLFFEIARIFYD